MKHYKVIRALILLLPLFFYACFGPRITAKSTRPGKLYEEFFVSANITQYFIDPLPFKSKPYKLKIDFTFRNHGYDTTRVFANYSLYSKEPVKRIDSVHFLINDEKYPFNRYEKLFLERVGKKYELRYSSRIKYGVLKKFIRNETDILVKTNDEMIRFSPPGRTKRRKLKLDEAIFKIIDLNSPE